MERIRIDGIAVRHHGYTCQGDRIQLIMDPEDIAPAFEANESSDCYLITQDGVTVGLFTLVSAEALCQQHMTKLTLKLFKDLYAPIAA